MRFSRPLAEANDFQRDCAVETLLARSKHHALTAAADFLQQVVIAKVSQYLGSTRCFFTMVSSSRSIRFRIFIGIVVIASGYRCVQKQTKSYLEQAGCAKSFGRVGKDLRPALSTNSRHAGHHGRVARALAMLYCAKFYHTLRSQHRNQMTHLIFDIAGNGNGVRDLLAQQDLITMAKPMESLSKGIIRHAQL